MQKLGTELKNLDAQIVKIIAADDVSNPLSLLRNWHREDDSIKPMGSPQEILRHQDEAGIFMKYANYSHKQYKKSDTLQMNYLNLQSLSLFRS